MDAEAVTDERSRSGRQNRVVPIPRRWDQACKVFGRAGDGGSKARHAEESTYTP
jgi:hypothetical protein